MPVRYISALYVEQLSITITIKVCYLVCEVSVGLVFVQQLHGRHVSLDYTYVQRSVALVLDNNNNNNQIHQ